MDTADTGTYYWGFTRILRIQVHITWGLLEYCGYRYILLGVYWNTEDTGTHCWGSTRILRIQVYITGGLIGYCGYSYMLLGVY